MAEDFTFRLSNVNLSSILQLSSEQSMLEEARICELAELAAEAAAFSLEFLLQDMSIYEILALLSSELALDVRGLHDGALEENIPRLNSYLSSLTRQDKSIFAQLYVERLRESGYFLTEEKLLPSSIVPETFVYVKNAFADEAYEVFSQGFLDPRVRYADSYKSAISEVLDSKVSYCILPLEEGGGRISTVSELLYRADLKIVSLTPVFGFDGTADMKYALVAKQFAPTEYTPDDDRYLEIRLPESDGGTLSDVLSVAKEQGISCYRVNTQVSSTRDGEEQYYSLIFRGDGHSFTSLLIYLTLFVPDFTPVGIYKNLE